MLRACLLLAIGSCVSALKLSASTTRRAALAAAPAALFAATSPAFAVGANKVGYACRGDEGCGLEGNAVARLAATPGQGEAAGIRFAGTYKDPAFPDLPRKLILAGTNVIVTGKDEAGGKEWKVKGKPYGKALVLDFSPKGGPTEVVARWNGLGLAFEDGNIWSKK